MNVYIGSVDTYIEDVVGLNKIMFYPDMSIPGALNEAKKVPFDIIILCGGYGYHQLMDVSKNCLKVFK